VELNVDALDTVKVSFTFNVLHGSSTSHIQSRT